MIKCGIVRDDSYDHDFSTHGRRIFSVFLEHNKPYQQRRIYSDEVPMATEGKCQSLRAIICPWPIEYGMQSFKRLNERIPNYEDKLNGIRLKEWRSKFLTEDEKKRALKLWDQN